MRTWYRNCQNRELWEGIKIGSKTVKEEKIIYFLLDLRLQGKSKN